MKLIRWALWSKYRLMGALCGALTGLVVLSGIVGALDAPEQAEQAAASETEERQGILTFEYGPQVEPEGTDREQVLAVSEAFLDTWTDPEQNGIEWAESLRPYAAPSLVAASYGVDQSQIPTGKVRRVKVESVTDSNALTRTKVGDLALFLSLEPTSSGWKVNNITADHDHDE